MRVLDKECVDSKGVSAIAKLEAFELAISYSDRFTLVGLTEDDQDIVVQDNKYPEDSELFCNLIPVSEVIEKPLQDIMGVLNETRSPIVLKGYTRIVGYYSPMTAWNASKVGEQRDRIKGRQSGGYGFNGLQGDASDLSDAMEYVDTLH